MGGTRFVMRGPYRVLSVTSGLMWGSCVKKNIDLVILTVSVKGAGVILNKFLRSGLRFITEVTASTSGARSRCTAGVGDVLALRGISGGRMDNAVVSSIIPPLGNVFGHTMGVICKVSPVLIKPKVGAKVGLHYSSPSSIKTSLVYNYITTRRLCNDPTLVVSVKATAGVVILSGDKAFANTSVVPKMGLTLGALTRNATRLPRVDLRTPGSIVNGGAVSYVEDNTILKGTDVLSNVVSHFGRRVNRDLPICTAKNVTPVVVPCYGRGVVLGRGLVLRNLGVLCGGGG